MKPCRVRYHDFATANESYKQALHLKTTVYLIFLFHFAEEEINDSELIADLASREADAPIFTKLGFSYGKAVRFKKEFQIARVCVRPSATGYKPTMADTSIKSFELPVCAQCIVGYLTEKWAPTLEEQPY